MRAVHTFNNLGISQEPCAFKWYGILHKIPLLQSKESKKFMHSYIFIALQIYCNKHDL